MKSLVLSATVILASTASATLYSADPVYQQNLWETFKSKFHKVYDTIQEDKNRFAIFLKNLITIDERNAMEAKNKGSAVHGITQFSDLSQAEFESRYLTAKPTMKSLHAGAKADHTVGEVDATAGLVDWTGKYTTPVKDQVRYNFFSSSVQESLFIIFHL